MRFLLVIGALYCAWAVREARVLVTGFGPFLGYEVNPSGDVAAALNGRCLPYRDLKVCFDGIVLSVDEAGANTVSDMLLSGVASWDAVLHLGLEDSAKGLKLETFAVNQLAEPTEGASAEGATCLNNSNYDQPTGVPAVPFASCEMPVTADLGRLSLEEALVFSLDDNCRGNGQCRDINHLISMLNNDATAAMLNKCLTEAWSRNAGTYYCNETLFRTLQAIRSHRIRVASGSLMPAVFTHLSNYTYLSV
jgi:pyrrolidone-carboxylate peptidase